MCVCDDGDDDRDLVERPATRRNLVGSARFRAGWVEAQNAISIFGQTPR